MIIPIKDTQLKVLILKSVVTSLLLFLALSLSSQASFADGMVKKSTSGICHDVDSSYYGRTKNYTAYNSIRECLMSGGRLPKRVTAPIEAAIKEADSEGREYTTLYDRDAWPHWIDEDKDCQNTRHELLISSSQVPVKFKRAKGCSVVSGKWYDPYSGKTFTDARDLDIDHIVALEYAHIHGGYNFTRAQRQAFANDPDNIIAVDLSLNRSKGSKGPTEFMPPNQSYRCEYLAKFDGIMVKYGLEYAPSEKRIIAKMQSACSQ